MNLRERAIKRVAEAGRRSPVNSQAAQRKKARKKHHLLGEFSARAFCSLEARRLPVSLLSLSTPSQIAHEALPQQPAQSALPPAAAPSPLPASWLDLLAPERCGLEQGLCTDKYPHPLSMSVNLCHKACLQMQVHERLEHQTG